MTAAIQYWMRRRSRQ